MYTTPKSYLDLLGLYGSMLKEKRQTYIKDREKLAVGVKKIEEAKKVVADLEAKLRKLKPVLDKKTEETGILMTKVQAEQTKTEQIQATVKEESKQAEQQAVRVKAVAADAQKDLDVAMPALEKALAQLDQLDKGDIMELGSYKTPPKAVMVVMEAVCLLLGEKTKWAYAKKVLTSSDFMKRLQGFNKDKISKQVKRDLRKYVKKKNMKPEVVGEVSSAAKSLCGWVHAMHMYGVVSKKVGPKKKKLEKMNKKLAKTKVLLQQKQDMLVVLEKRVRLLTKKLELVRAGREHTGREHTICWPWVLVQ